MLAEIISLRTKAFCNKSSSSKLFWNDFLKRVFSIKKKFELEDSAKNALWFLETFAICTLKYIDTFRLLRRRKYRPAWDDLERVEIILSQLDENLFLEEFESHIVMVLRLVLQLQSTYPYKYFASPEIKMLDWECTICGLKSTPSNPCGHQIGRVYSGKFCGRKITKAKMLGLSIVTNPVQKYSVLIPEGVEFDFSVTQFVLERLGGPFQDWSGQWGYLRHPHSKFADVALDSKCPCGSNLHYDECCLMEDGILLDHFQMETTGKSERHVEIIKRGGSEH